MDDSFRRPGSVPFHWEIEPGIPKPDHRASFSSSPPPSLTPPPRMSPALPKSRSQSSSSSSRSFYPPRLPPSAATATSLSRLRGQDVAARGRRSKTCTEEPPVQHVALPGGCFPVPSSLRRKDQNRKTLPRRSASSRSSLDSWWPSPFRSSSPERDETEISAPWFF